MTLLGELFGYDSRDNDILGSHRDERNNCIVCGVSALSHTPEMEAECVKKLYGVGALREGEGKPQIAKEKP
jgi:hypothetical protein